MRRRHDGWQVRQVLLCACVLGAGCVEAAVRADDDTDVRTDTAADQDVSAQDGSGDDDGTEPLEPGDVDADGVAPPPPPPPRCGDGRVDQGEGCDDGAANSDSAPDACRTDCQPARCGDGVVDEGEACDRTGNQFCTSACALVDTPLCDICSADSNCGEALDACLRLPEGGRCGMQCRSDADCPPTAKCSDARSFAGAPVRQCVPLAGTCAACIDRDGDGYGDGPACAGPDCAPLDASIRPGAAERCNGLDDDCDGVIDEGLERRTFYPDSDRDGFGSATAPPVQACERPPDHVSSNTDCNDGDRTVRPDAPELCDGLDNDCDGRVDEDVVSRDFWPDLDGDGAGDSRATPRRDCRPPSGYVDNNRDCNDRDAAVRPGAVEICDNGIDDRCNGDVDCDDSTCNTARVCQRCATDPFEPNNTRETAATLPAGDNPGLTVCAGDDDWFRHQARANQSLTVSLDFLNASGDVDLQLVSSSGRVLQESLSVEDGERVDHVSSADETVFVRVYLFGDTPANGYALRTRVGSTDVACPAGDRYDPNNSAPQAVRIPDGSYPALIACEGSDDWFRFSAFAGSEVTVTATFLHAEGDIDLEVRNGAGNLVAEADSQTNNETLRFVPTASGFYALRVTLFEDTGSVTGTPYALSITTR